MVLKIAGIVLLWWGMALVGPAEENKDAVRAEENICEQCNGTGKIGPSLLYMDALKNQIRERVTEYKLKKLVLQVHPFIEAYLNQGMRSPRKKWSKELNCKIKVTGMSTFLLLQYAFTTEQGEEIPV